MDVFAIFFLVFGVILTAVGIVLFAKMGTQGTSSVKMFGFEFQLGGSALVIFVVGAVLVLVPVIFPDRFPTLKTLGQSDASIAPIGEDKQKSTNFPDRESPAGKSSSSRAVPPDEKKQEQPFVAPKLSEQPSTTKSRDSHTDTGFAKVGFGGVTLFDSESECLEWAKGTTDRCVSATSSFAFWCKKLKPGLWLTCYETKTSCQQSGYGTNRFQPCTAITVADAKRLGLVSYPKRE